MTQTIRITNLSSTEYRESQNLRHIGKGTMPSDFASRAIFHSWEGSLSYISRAEHPSLTETSKQTVDLNLKIISKLGFKGLISIGAGEGFVDEQMILKHNPQFEYYVPVDISKWLLFTGFMRVSPIINIPYVLNYDIECLSSSEIGTFEALKGERLFTCLGNMLGNSDLGEFITLSNLKKLMTHKGDKLLISVGIGEFDEIRDLDALKNGFHLWELVFSGIKGSFDMGNVTPRPEDFTLNLKKDSDIGSTSIEITYMPLNKKAFTLRRYNIDLLLHWLNQKLGFFVENYDIKDTGAGFSVGTFLLRL